MNAYSRSRTGFLLYEICLALFALSILSLLIASWHCHLIGTQQHVVDNIKALFLARSLLDEMRAFKKIPSLKSKEDFKISCKLQPKPGLPHYADIEVSVTWALKEKARSITLKSGMLL